MRAQLCGGWPPPQTRGIAALVVLAVLGGLAEPLAANDRSGPTRDEAVALGEELFQREWIVGDERSPRGDGLGPVYNDSSCVACHNLGATGGAGPANKNIMLLSVSPMGGRSSTSTMERVTPTPSPRIPPEAVIPPVLKSMYAYVKAENARLEEARKKNPPPQPAAPSETTTTTTTSIVVSTPRPDDAPATATKKEADLEKLAAVHPGFRTSRSVVLHRFGTHSEYDKWRMSVLGVSTNVFPGTRTVKTGSGDETAPTPESTRRNQMSQLMLARMESQLAGISRSSQRQVGDHVIITSERNSTALFGSGLIDALSEEAIVAAAAARAGANPVEFPEIRGRVCRLKDGRIGRFGWKGQMASLGDFVLNACAVELGLDVPDHPQASDPVDPEAKSKGLDLTERECAALVSFVASLPAPLERAPAGAQEAGHIAAGREAFASIGCAACHRPKLGNVEGIYSDLLLHDMGPSLADSGSYGINLPDSPEEGPPGSPPLVIDQSRPEGRASIVGATRQEWRTPPLWGLRDSGPYLHDGRASTIEQAITQHAGEARATAERFFGLTPQERMELITFLKSLVAPTQQMARVVR